MSEPFFFPLSFRRRSATSPRWPARNSTPASRIATIEGLAPIETAGPRDLAYLDNPRYFDALATTRAAACLLRSAARPRAPSSVATLVVDDPYRAFARVAAHLVPSSLRAAPLFGAGISPGAFVDPQARLEPGVDVEPGAVIAAGAEIGTGTLIGANAVIGAGVRIGRDCTIGAERQPVLRACSATASSCIRACASARTVSASRSARAGI